MALEPVEKKIDKLWNKEAYFQLIEDCQTQGGDEAKFLTYKIITEINQNGEGKVLDVGCGEGGVLNDIAKNIAVKARLWGIDVAQVGIERARKKNISQAEFQVYDGGPVPFCDNEFNITFSTFVFEHLTDPEFVFNEMVRVTKPGGHVIIACPNYGSPFFRSPCNKTNPIILMVKRLVQLLYPKFCFKNSFNWNPVTPILLPQDAHVMDYDTTIEPNLLFFIKHLRNNTGLKVVEFDSGWSQFRYTGTSRLKRVFLDNLAWLGTHNGPLVKYCGPFFFVVVKKI